MKSKKDEIVWMPYHEYIMEKYWRGEATRAEYELALEYDKEKNKNGKIMNYNEWLEQRNV